MQFNKKILGAIVFAAGMMSAGAAFAASAVATTTLNVRSGPSTSYRVVDVLRDGERVEINRCRGGWCEIDHRGNDGWVSQRYLATGSSRPNRPSRPGSNNNNSDPEIGFCIDTPDFKFGINCNNNDARPTRPGRPNRPVSQVCFYENYNYRGASFCASPGEAARRLGSWNDRISSIKVEGRASATVCEDIFYRGRCATVNSSIRALDRRNNDIISSYRVR